MNIYIQTDYKNGSTFTNWPDFIHRVTFILLYLHADASYPRRNANKQNVADKDGPHNFFFRSDQWETAVPAIGNF